jgi:hypothetical protein
VQVHASSERAAGGHRGERPDPAVHARAHGGIATPEVGGW